MSRLAIALVVVMAVFAPLIAFAQGATDCTFPGSSGTFPGGGNTGGVFPGGPCNSNSGGNGAGGGLPAGGSVAGGGGAGGGGTMHASASEPTMLLTLAASLLLAAHLRRR